mgnify:CR=1 FL=1
MACSNVIAFLPARKGAARVRFIDMKRPVRIDQGDGPPRFPFKEVAARLRGVIYRGGRVECSCCDRTFNLFLYSPYMTGMCPYCLSVERYRLLCRYLRDETDFGSRACRVLDVAPMWCFQEFCRSYSTIEYLSIDIASPMAMRHMDLCDLPLEDDRFDWIFCYHVLEHIDDDRKALSELFRVLAPGGRAVIQVPIHRETTVERHELSKQEQEEILKFADHRRAYGRDFRDLLERAGFTVEVVGFVRQFTEKEINRFGLDPTEDLYVCTK